MSKKNKTVDELLEETLVPEEEQPYKIPDNWVWSRVSQLNQVVTGTTPSKKNQEYYGDYLPFVKPGDLDQNRYVLGSVEYLSKKGANKSRVIPKGSTLLCCIGSIGKSAYSCVECSTNQQINSLVPKNGLVESLFTYYYSLSPAFHGLLVNHSSATTLSIINKTKVSKLPFPLPPHAEQKRIINHIGSMFDKIDKAKELIEEAREDFKKRKTAILSKAFRGELTKKWRNENSDLNNAQQLLKEIEEIKGKYKKKKIDSNEILFDIPGKWKWVRVGDIADLISGQHIKKKDYNTEGKGIPYLTGPSDFGSINPFVSKWTTNPKITASKDDILITVKGSGVGKVNILHMNDVAISRQLKALKPVIVNIKYVYYYLESKYDYFQHISTGTAIPGLSIKDILNCYIPLPPLKEQDRIVKIIDKFLDKENTIFHLVALNKQIINLKKSILSKAFRGELGTNDSNDENSIELLKEVLSKKVK